MDATPSVTSTVFNLSQDEDELFLTTISCVEVVEFISQACQGLLVPLADAATRDFDNDVE